MTEERSESAAGLSFKMGEALLRNGAEIFRVQETMERVARAYNIEEYDVYVLSNAIFANAVENGEKIDTKLKFVPGSTVHFGRIVGINQLSREIVAGKVSVEEAYARLREIVSIPYTHPIRLDLACAVGSACFSYLFGGTVFDAAAAFICGFLLQVFLNAIDSRTASKFIINLASSAVVAVCAVLLFAVGLGNSLDKIIIGSIIRLVPGVALTTSIRDFLNGDYLSGTIRMIDAFLVGGCIAIGVGALMTPEAVFDWAIQTAVAFVATIAFAIIFHTPREQYVCAGLVGAFGWLIYIVYVYFTGDVVFASFFAALGLTYLARVFSFARKAPLPVFLIAGIFPIVPGAGIYYTGYHIFMNNNAEAMSKGVETIKIAIAIALGIGIVVSLPRFFFTLRRKGSTT